MANSEAEHFSHRGWARGAEGSPVGRLTRALGIAQLHAARHCIQFLFSTCRIGKAGEITQQNSSFIPSMNAGRGRGHVWPQKS